jgi:transposase
MTRICQICGAEIVYGYAMSKADEEKEFICDECANTLNAGYNPDGSYEPPALFPVRTPGHC